MAILETLTESKKAALDVAIEKITIKVLKSIQPGEEIDLDGDFCLYRYIEDNVVVVNSVEEWDEVLQVLWDEKDGVIFEVL